MNRRGFLGALAGAMALDPEKLLWRPGAKLISIPKPRPIPFSVSRTVNGRTFTAMDIIDAARRQLNAVTETPEEAFRRLNDCLDRWSHPESVSKDFENGSYDIHTLAPNYPQASQPKFRLDIA